jgi:hypothetical protein
MPVPVKTKVVGKSPPIGTISFIVLFFVVLLSQFSISSSPYPKGK